MSRVDRLVMAVRRVGRALGRGVVDRLMAQTLSVDRSTGGPPTRLLSLEQTTMDRPTRRRPTGRPRSGWQDARRTLAWCLVACLAHVAHAQDTPIPALTARVTDTAQLMTTDQRAALEAVLADYETKKGTQIAVLTVSSTAPEAIEQYGIRVADAWKIGRKGTADGVIVIVAKDNPPDLRRLRIEVGRGLEGAVPDASAKRIIDENIAPHFRQGDYYGGLVAGVNRIEGLLEGEALPAPAATRPSTVQTGSGGGGIGGLGLVLLLFVVLPFVLRMFGGGRSLGYAAGRGSNGGLGSFVTGAVLGSIVNRGGGGFGGGGGGGGGFSGGGGDFGGGGASGNW